MREAFGELWRLAWILIAGALVLTILWYAASANAFLWRMIATRNPDTRTPAIARKLDTIVIARRGSLGPTFTGKADHRQYAGTIITVTPSGLTFSIVPPLNLMCPSFSVPFDQLELHSTSWALWREPFALRVKGQPDYDIIVGRDTVSWIRSQTEQAPFGRGDPP